MRKYILDLKTIKKLKLTWYNPVKISKVEWDEYYVYKGQTELSDIQKKFVRDIRFKLKSNIRLKVDLNKNIGTYVTFLSNGRALELSKKEAYKFYLKRIREKIQNSRAASRDLKVDEQTGQQQAYRLPKTYGLVRVKNNTFINFLQRDLIDVCFDSKLPKTNDKYIGIELEMYMPITQNQLAEELVKYHKNITIKDDCSIVIEEELYDEYCDCGEDDCHEEHNQSDWHSVELAILMTEQEFSNGLLLEICSILKNIGVKTNKTCGMHVHLDMRNRSLGTCFHNLTLSQDLLFNLVESYRKTNTYCRKVETNNIHQEDEQHYNAINGNDAYNKYKTIEVRIHHGETDYKAIQSWINLLLKIVNYNQLLHYDVSTDSKELIKTIQLDENTMKYYSLT